MSMQLITGLIYCVAVLVWLVVLAIVLFEYVRNPRIFGTTRLLLLVVAIDTCRNLIENVYFGLFFGGQYGFFPAALAESLGQPRARHYPESTQYRRGRLRAWPSAVALAAPGGDGARPVGPARGGPPAGRPHH